MTITVSGTTADTTVKEKPSSWPAPIASATAAPSASRMASSERTER